ncbi:hypothetical protein ERJ75_000655000 [Trypanosoma vivax]|nr:hypothetical protein ERJ75_000655000 [Trypanosoma vivax]
MPEDQDDDEVQREEANGKARGVPGEAWEGGWGGAEVARESSAGGELLCFRLIGRPEAESGGSGNLAKGTLGCLGLRGGGGEQAREEKRVGGVRRLPEKRDASALFSFVVRGTGMEKACVRSGVACWGVTATVAAEKPRGGEESDMETVKRTYGNALACNVVKERGRKRGVAVKRLCECTASTVTAREKPRREAKWTL